MLQKTRILVYSILSIVGFIIPNYIVFQTVMTTGTYDFGKLFSAMNANLYTQFTAADLGLTAIAFCAFYYIEAKKKPIKYVWLPFFGTLLVGLSFGFPLLLLLRELDNENN